MTRGTKQKEAVLRAVKLADTHPTAEYIYEEVRKTIPNISLGTVYRNLRLLKEENYIAELYGLERPSHFDGNTSPHDHFYCRQCGSIMDIAPFPGDLNSQIAKQTGLNISEHSLEFFGLCPACSPQSHANQNTAGTRIL